MVFSVEKVSLITVASPLLCSILVGMFKEQISRMAAHLVTILGVLVSFISSIYIAKYIILDGNESLNFAVYTWISGSKLFPYDFSLGFLIDRLSSYMLVVVTFISLLVHIYSVGYMSKDDGYHRFFSYISFFTFAMLLLVIANNFLQLFVGWEAVGLASYLLIGFWYQKGTAVQAGLKAFIVNRIGDLGLIVGIALIFSYTGSLDYSVLFAKVGTLQNVYLPILPGISVPVITLICLSLFLGAMAKSAQIPLHVWLPDSMEGPTPISALIHAATMVTAGIFMVSRMSFVYEYSKETLSIMLIIGATGALFTGLLALVANDLKRLIAFSTLSQLGYMVAALGSSAYSAAMFHLGTHAVFKSILFLCAGSLILGLNHEQDIRQMGGLCRKFCITYWAFLIGALAICAIPPFAGFYSKEIIIEFIGKSEIYGANYAYYCVLLGAMVTSLYIFRAFFMVFHRSYQGHLEQEQIKQPGKAITIPLIILIIPSIVLGYVLVQFMFEPKNALFGNSLYIQDLDSHMQTWFGDFKGLLLTFKYALSSLSVILSFIGIVLAWLFYVLKNNWPSVLVQRLPWVHRTLVNGYWFNQVNDLIFVRSSFGLGSFFYKIVDKGFIDKLLINAFSSKFYQATSLVRKIQTGYLPHYIGYMIFGMVLLILWLSFGV